MYLVIGLNQAGKLGLADVYEERPSIESLEELVKDFSYTQLLVVDGSGGGQKARFEVHDSPLWQVELT